MSRHIYRAQDYVEHMLEACKRLEKYTAASSLEHFVADILLQDAVVRNFQVLGEASNKLRDVLPDAADRLPQIPFAKLYGLRNRMIHAYPEIDYETIFELATRDVPELRAGLTAALACWPADLIRPSKRL